jgi:hypothetical protein
MNNESLPDIESLEELILILKENPNVLGIVTYGSRQPHDARLGGDFDLFVFLSKSPAQIESIHLYIGDIPVDLSIRIMSDLERELPLSPIDLALPEGDILHDPTGNLRKLISAAGKSWTHKASELSENNIVWSRFSQTHLIDKVRGRIKSEPLLCAFLLNSNIFWLVETYFRVQGRSYPGEKPALLYIQRNDPKIYQIMCEFYETHDLHRKLDLTIALTNHVLEPIGGPWKKGEVLAFPLDEKEQRLSQKAKVVMDALFVPSTRLGS